MEVNSCSCCSSSPIRLDTKAQVGTHPPKQELSAIQKRAKSKFLSYGLVKALYSLDSPLKHAYGRSLGCTKDMEVENGVARSTYCKNRWCLTCARIRTAVLIEKYKETLDDEFYNPYFVTLTVPNVSAEGLEKKVVEMFKTFKTVIEKRKKQ